MPFTISRRLGLTGRIGRIAAQAAVVTAVVGGTVAYAHADKNVTLTIDGDSRQVSAFAGTVDELLEDEGIETGARDIVAPAPATELEDGASVVVRYARPFTLTVDGLQRQYWTTELTVDKALAALGLRAEGAELSASRSTPIGREGLTLAMVTPKAVTVTADGKVTEVTTTAATVGEMLADLGITVRASDKLSHVPATAVTGGLAVAVARVDTKTVTVDETVTFGTEKVSTSALYKGQSKVVTAGRNGARTATYTLTLTDGKETARTLLRARVTRAPVTQVVQVGSKAKPASSGGGGSVAGADGLNWAALAQCESGGNPSIVSSNGLYHGLYQFSVSTWRSVGGSGLPSDASSAEQTYRAKLLYNRSGAGQWPHCGPRLFS